MNIQAMNKLEYPRVIEEVTSRTITFKGRQLAERLAPIANRSIVASRLGETEEARLLLSKGMHVPLPAMEGMEELFALLGTGYVPDERQFGTLALFIRSCGQLMRFMGSKSDDSPMVAVYATSMHELKDLLGEIEACIDRGRIRDTASAELAKIRRRIGAAEEKLHRKLEGLMSRHAEHLQERLVSQRGGRYVLPVKREYRKRLSGAVLDESASGQTVFIEPAETAGLQMDLSSLRTEEQREELQVLARLTESAEASLQELSVNAETVAHYDFLFAKAKWALSLDARPVELTEDGTFDLKQARHPFLAGRAVPLDVRVDGTYRSLLITGPNTGGKTVALKTVGLLTLMAQSGLLIPAAEGSRLSVFRSVEADIGDGQSLDRSLSTFSSHVRNVIEILSQADGRTLVLLDELATGTDPGEGVGLSIAVLEELFRRGSVVLATTHFNEIKAYARDTPGFRNARMAFDEDSLMPLYRLDMGEAGDSYAFIIAKKLGIVDSIINRARAIAEELQRGGIERSSAITSVVPALGIPINEVQNNMQQNRGNGTKGRKGSIASQENGKAYQKDRAETATDKEAEISENVPLTVGDIVWIPSWNRSAVVFRLPDERGVLLVQIQGEKHRINRKRVRRYIDSKQLYPDNYDLDIVFDTVENRKKRKQMSKGHVEGLKIEKKEME